MSNQDLQLATDLLIGRFEYDQKGRLRTQYLGGQQEAQARQAIARLLRSECALNGQLRWHLADLFDPSGWQQRKINFAFLRRRRPIDDIANVHIFSLVLDGVRAGKSVDQAIESVVMQFSISEDLVKQIWSKYRPIYYPRRHK